MAGTVRTLATISVRQHIPSIRFPIRQDAKFSFPPPVSTSAATQMQTSPVTPTGNAVKPASGSGIEDRDLPARYSRKPWSEEDIELVRYGGPY